MKDVRPTSGRVISALFSILGEKVAGCRFLDLFSGTGRVGLEALRRGAESCVFVESVRTRAEEIRRHSEDSVVLSLEVRRAVSWLVKRGMTFDVIFADPPYSSGWCDVLPSLPGLMSLFAPEAVMILEHSSRENLALADNPNSLVIDSVREYGETCLTFFRRNNI